MIDNSTLDLKMLTDITILPGLEGTEVVVYEPLELTPVESNPKNRTDDLENDYICVRQNFHHQNQMLFDAAKIMLENAKNSDSPRHMEVFATLVGQMTTTNKELLKLHNEMKGITNEQVNVAKDVGTPTQVNINGGQVVFNGSPFDLATEIGDAHEASLSSENVVGEEQ